MSDSGSERLRAIKTFPSLVKYLRDELDWPIDTEDFEDLTFSYEPEELGIDSSIAAKIEEIKQLRPLVSNQPWGIFFIKFEPKHLPVVALRRILGQLVFKKRTSAMHSERVSWQLNDLMFISAYGEGEQRQINLAHFAENRELGALPTLKVLGWDDADRDLKIDYIRNEMQSKFRWPDDTSNIEDWRSTWASVFTLRHREVITTSKMLAERLAELATAVRNRVNKVIVLEHEDGPLNRLLKAFRVALVHDLTEDGFADMYAQTISYGLLSEKLLPKRDGGSSLGLSSLKIINPFLGELLDDCRTIGRKRGLIDFDELGVGEVEDLLNDPKTKYDDILRDFDNRNPTEDPVIHFYEHFLREYDVKQRVRRGVFFTPKPVVSFIVRSVDELLRKQFALADGLADTTTWGEMLDHYPDIKLPEHVSKDDPFVQILDPATGTGTFLVEVIDVIHRTMLHKWQLEGRMALEFPQFWNDYVPRNLLPRLYGFEIMMAPYAIAHMKIALKLLETGYTFGSTERAHVYLTNTLEPPKNVTGQLELLAPALANEARAANDAKLQTPFSVLIGNPPYSKASQNLGPEYEHLIERFRFFHSERIHEPGAILFERDINNDYIKFIGYYHYVLRPDAPGGIVGIITSNSYLDGKNFRGVRNALLEKFNKINITNLHGDQRSGALKRQGIHDENVFDIETGVCIATMVKSIRQRSPRVFYGEIIGSYEQKSFNLLEVPSNVGYEQVQIQPKQYDSFLPQTSGVADEYSSFPQLDQLFRISVDGIKTSRDGLVLADSHSECSVKIRKFRDHNGPASAIESSFGISVSSWDFEEAQRHLRQSFTDNAIRRISYRPFDFRYIYHDPNLVFSHRTDKMRHMLLVPNNIAIVCASRLSAHGFDNILVTDCLSEMKYASHDTNSRLFPMFVSGGELFEEQKVSNFRHEIMSFPSSEADATDSSRTISAIGYIYAILQAPSYRNRYNLEIKNDFPRIPKPFSATLFEDLAKQGLKLIEAHLLRSQPSEDRFHFVGELGSLLVTPHLEQSKLFITNHGYFNDVTDELFNFRIAGYQVCKTWFSAGNKSGLQRKGQKITAPMVEVFRQMLDGISETIRGREVIDAIIEEHGGWPGAFVVNNE